MTFNSFVLSIHTGCTFISTFSCIFVVTFESIRKIVNRMHLKYKSPANVILKIPGDDFKRFYFQPKS